MRIRTKTRTEKAARTRKRNANPLLAAKKLAERPQPAVKVFKISGREVCSKTPEGKAEYERRRNAMVNRQKFLCGICGLFMNYEQATFDHENGRGHGGANRDDRIILPSGQIQNRAVHWTCNTGKASKRGYENSGVRTERTGRFTI